MDFKQDGYFKVILEECCIVNKCKVCKKTKYYNLHKCNPTKGLDIPFIWMLSSIMIFSISLPSQVCIMFYCSKYDVKEFSSN